MFEVREIETALRELSGGTPQCRTLEATLQVLQYWKKNIEEFSDVIAYWYRLFQSEKLQSKPPQARLYIYFIYYLSFEGNAAIHVF